MVNEINVRDVLKTELAVGPEKGKYIFSEIKNSIDNNEKVIIDFSGVKVMTTSFLNYAIGELYRVKERDELNKYITIDLNNLSNAQIRKIKLVMDNSRTKIEQSEIDDVIYHG